MQTKTKFCGRVLNRYKLTNPKQMIVLEMIVIFHVAVCGSQVVSEYPDGIRILMPVPCISPL